MSAKQWWVIWVSAASVGGAAVAACSGDFSGCLESRTCPLTAAGAGGDDFVATEQGGAATTQGGALPSSSSMGGATTGGNDGGEPSGGAQSLSSCQRDADCDDGDACNGVETCGAGA